MRRKRVTGQGTALAVRHFDDMPSLGTARRNAGATVGVTTGLTGEQNYQRKSPVDSA